jgi:hypothetical protein
MARLSVAPWPFFNASILLLATLPSVSAQVTLPIAHSRIIQAVDDSTLTRLSGNTHPLARPEFDRGSLDDATPLHRMVLVLKRSADQESALKQLIDQQQDKSSSNYLQWLAPEGFGAAFGPTDRDLSLLTGWLSGHGFTGIQISAGRTLVEFSGSAGAVRTAFHTSIRRFNVSGQEYLANASDPQIPTAFAPVIAGVASLNNFPRRAANLKLGNFRRDPTSNATTRLPASTAQQAQIGAALSQPTFTLGGGSGTLYAVSPYDFATIYNVLPLWNASTPIDGTGQTIAIVGQTEINPADFVNFRNLFGLPLGDTATVTGTQYLNIIHNGVSPGVTNDEPEADIDTQWSGAVAKGATIEYVVSKSTDFMQGTDLSAIYIVNQNLAPVMSYSYGECELFLGTGGNAFYNALWQQAAAQGITVLISSGDSGSAGCDNSGADGATDGVAINGLGSTPYNLAVGGTDFYMPNGGTAFWNATNNSSTEASAKGYIPEVPWNQSCTNSVFTTAGAFVGETPEQICNNPTAISDGLSIVTGGGGGFSTCTQSDGVSPASCTAGYGKPSWQTGSGVPADGMRDVPDVSLFASAGFFGAFYVVCQQSSNPDEQPCSLTNFAGFGGTSVAAPAFAGILSLVNQKTGNRTGNVGYVLYNLAGQQVQSGIACNSATGAPAANCIFNDVTTGTIAMPCLDGTPNCTVANSSDRYGVLSGFSSAAGYDLASGLGSVNAANLVNSWANATFVSSTTTLSLTPIVITHGGSSSATVNVSANSGIPTGSVSIGGLAASSPVLSGTLASGSYTALLGNLTGGSYAVTARYAGDGVYAAGDSSPVTLLVTPETSITSLLSLLYNASSGSSTAVSSFSYGNLLLLRASVSGLSGQGAATGNILFSDNGVALAGGSLPLNSSGATGDQTALLAPGVHTIGALYSGDKSFNASQSAPVVLTIAKAATTCGFSFSAPSLVANAATTLTVQIVPQTAGYGLYPSGSVTVKAGSTVLASTTLSQTSAGVTTITLSASQLPGGTNPITIVYSGDANYTGSFSTVNTLAPATGFTLSPSTMALTVAQGTASSAVTLTATPTGGFHSAVSFACTNGLPSGATCLFNPSTVALIGSTVATTTLSIALAASGSEIYATQARNHRTSARFPFGGSAALAGAILLLLPCRDRHGKSRCSILILLLAASALSFSTGCGSDLTTTAGQPVTAAGAYVITVTAAAGSTIQATTITLTVQ